MTDEEIEALDAAGLVYVSDEEPGYKRIVRGRGFSYHAPDGSLVDEDTRRWIDSLVIPPAWTDVWICTRPSGHLLVTGRDAEGRKQYLYHPSWTELRESAKFDRMYDFGRQLVRIRKATREHLALDGLPRERVLALVVRLMDETLIRIGNDRYARANGTFGLTTITAEHVEVEGEVATFEFIGKNSKPVDVAIVDRQLADLVARCVRLDAPELFAYRSGPGELKDVTSEDVNQYLREISRIDVSAKDFRTWGASSTVVDHLATGDDSCTFLCALDDAASLLNNTRAVCRASYVHPELEAAFRERHIQEAWARSRQSRWYGRSERALLKLLE